MCRDKFDLVANAFCTAYTLGVFTTAEPFMTRELSAIVEAFATFGAFVQVL